MICNMYIYTARSILPGTSREYECLINGLRKGRTRIIITQTPFVVFRLPAVEINGGLFI